MINIVPNWHPIFVHYSIALLSIAVMFYFARLALPKDSKLNLQWLTVANWCLWVGCLFTVGTVLAGIDAFNTVAHDNASHIAMTTHRNWAIPSAALFLMLGISAFFLNKDNRQPGFKFLSTSFVALILLMGTGWLGAEAVYRYGIGVMSLPQVTAGSDGHNHSHGDVHEHKNHTKPSFNGADLNHKMKPELEAHSKVSSSDSHKVLDPHSSDPREVVHEHNSHADPNVDTGESMQSVEPEHEAPSEINLDSNHKVLDHHGNDSGDHHNHDHAH
jgi:uncharacterized membrane protein